MIPTGNGHQPDVVSFGPFTVDRASGVLLRAGADVHLPPKGMGVLLCLLERPGAVVSKDDLLQAVWNGTAVTDSSLTEAVRTLRDTLGDDPRNPVYVQTVHRRGYRFIAPVHEATNGTPDAPGLDKPKVEPGNAAAPTRPEPSIGPSPRSWAAFRLALGVVALVVLVLAGVALWLRPPGNDSATREIFSFGAPPESAFFPQSHAVAISPDGQTVVVGLTSGSDEHHLATRRLEELVLRPMEGSLGRWALYPVFSPDGGRVVYLSSALNGLEAVDLSGGEAQSLCADCTFPAGRFHGADVAADGTVYYAHGPTLDQSAAPAAPEGVALWRIRPAGGPPELVIDAAAVGPGADYLWPHLLPGDRWMLVTRRRGRTIEDATIVALDVATGEQRPLIEDGFNARWVASGHLVFGRDGDVWAVAFDAERIALRGPEVPIPIEKQVAMREADGSAGFDVADNGTFVFHPGVYERWEYGIVVVHPDGHKTPLIEDRAEFLSARLSPDQSKLAACVRRNRDEIRVYDLAAGTSFTIANSGADLCDPVWNVDGTWIAYSSNQRDLLVIQARERAEGRLLLQGGEPIELADWTPDGAIVFTVIAEPGNADIWMIDADCRGPAGSTSPCTPEARRPLLSTPRDEVAGRLSPDGRWITARIGEPWAIHVLPYPDLVPSIEVSEGRASQWSADGSTLHVRSRRWMSLPWRGAAPVDSAAMSQRQVPGRISPIADLIDGTGLVGIDTSARRSQTEEVVVITNWFDDLRRLAPLGR